MSLNNPSDVSPKDDLPNVNSIIDKLPPSKYHANSLRARQSMPVTGSSRPHISLPYTPAIIPLPKSSFTRSNPSSSSTSNPIKHEGSDIDPVNSRNQSENSTQNPSPSPSLNSSLNPSHIPSLNPSLSNPDHPTDYERSHIPSLNPLHTSSMSAPGHPIESETSHSPSQNLSHSSSMSAPGHPTESETSHSPSQNLSHSSSMSAPGHPSESETSHSPSQNLSHSSSHSTPGYSTESERSQNQSHNAVSLPNESERSQNQSHNAVSSPNESERSQNQSHNAVSSPNESERSQNQSHNAVSSPNESKRSQNQTHNLSQSILQNQPKISREPLRTQNVRQSPPDELDRSQNQPKNSSQSISQSQPRVIAREPVRSQNQLENPLKESQTTPWRKSNEYTQPIIPPVIPPSIMPSFERPGQNHPKTPVPGPIVSRIQPANPVPTQNSITSASSAKKHPKSPRDSTPLSINGKIVNRSDINPIPVSVPTPNSNNHNTVRRPPSPRHAIPKIEQITHSSQPSNEEQSTQSQPSNEEQSTQSQPSNEEQSTQSQPSNEEQSTQSQPSNEHQSTVINLQPTISPASPQYTVRASSPRVSPRINMVLTQNTVSSDDSNFSDSRTLIHPAPPSTHPVRISIPIQRNQSPSGTSPGSRNTSGTSSVPGNTSGTSPGSGNTSGTSSVPGNITGTLPGSGNTSGTSSVSENITGTSSGSRNISGTSSVPGNTTGISPGSANITGKPSGLQQGQQRERGNQMATVKQTANNKPNYAAMTPDQREYARIDFQCKYSRLREYYPQYNITLPGPEDDLDVLHARYRRYIQQIHADYNIDRYRMILIIVFMGIEFIGTRFLGLSISGFTKFQLRRMEQYEELLIEVGEKYHSVGGISTGWPVEVRIIFTTLVSAVLFLMVNTLASGFGPEITDGLVDLIMDYICGDRRSKRPPQTTNENQTSSPSGAPDPPPPRNNGGFDLSSILSGLGSLMGGGSGSNNNRQTTNNKTNNTTKQRTRPTPRFNQ
jgi:hypothetical protein